jgi:heme b synthase
MKEIKQSHSVPNSLRLIFWETTSGCNLECIHCRRLEISKELAKSDLTTEEALAFIDAVTTTYKPILVFSGGEPLMRPDIFDIASFAIKRGLTVALATNGTLISDEIAQKIKAIGVDRVSISIDGASAKTHNSFRKIDGAYEQAMQGIAHLRAHDVPFQINVTVAKHNVDELPDLYDLSLKIGAVALHLFMLVPVGCGVEIADEIMLSSERQEEVLNWLYDISRKKKLQVKATCAPQYYRIIRQRAKVEGITLNFQTHGMAAVTKGCLAGVGVCFVSHKGEVFPCGYLPVEAGNIRNEPFSEIWERAEVFEKLRNPDLLKGKCGLCEYKKVCGGCRARAYAQFGDFLDEEPYCIYQTRLESDQ